MSSRATRHSPRLQVATPVLSSPKISVRTNINRTRPEISSPLAVTLPDIADEGFPSVPQHSLLSEETPYSMISSMPPATIPPADMHLMATHDSDPSAMYDATLATMTIRDSIEDEPQSSTDELSLESRASSSQESLRSERLVPQTDGVIMPSRPILGEDEYAIALPAEGKVQAIYAQTLKIKRKAVLRFIQRRGAVMDSNTGSTKTHERNEMIELVQRLHDTTTHTDLGLPGIPTQYTIPSQQHAAYAEYAGSKFVFLGALIDNMKRRNCTIAIMAQSSTMPLLEEYLKIRHININARRRTSLGEPQPQTQTQALDVELLPTGSSNVIELVQKPNLILGFDASLTTQDAQLLSLRRQFNDQLPVLHLITSNSSEHVERCLPVNMPSPMRLKVLVRATYQAQEHIGGAPTYVPVPSDEPQDGRPMDLAELNCAIRKSPRRKLEHLAVIIALAALSQDFLANWTLDDMPDIVYDELDDLPPSSKQDRSALVGHQTGRTRSQTPLAHSTMHRGRSQTPGSRLSTPTSKKRQLDVDATHAAAKRQRLTPVERLDVIDEHLGNGQSQEASEMELNLLRIELMKERQAREALETQCQTSHTARTQWQASLAELQARYERRMQKSHEQSREVKKLSAAVQNSVTRIETLNSVNTGLKNQLIELKAELMSARHDLKDAGGATAALELVREEARSAAVKTVSLEKSLDNQKRDFEFTRDLYQQVSSKAAQLATENSRFETEVARLTKDASDEKRRLQQMSHTASINLHLSRINELEHEKRSRELLLKKQDAEITALKRTRGVQTRGSSVQPGSPAPRSRQSSPAAGLLAPPTGSRASALRHQR